MAVRGIRGIFRSTKLAPIRYFLTSLHGCALSITDSPSLSLWLRVLFQSRAMPMHWRARVEHLIDCVVAFFPDPYLSLAFFSMLRCCVDVRERRESKARSTRRECIEAVVRLRVYTEIWLCSRDASASLAFGDYAFSKFLLFHSRVLTNDF